MDPEKPSSSINLPSSKSTLAVSPSKTSQLAGTLTAAETQPKNDSDSSTHQQILPENTAQPESEQNPLENVTATEPTADERGVSLESWAEAKRTSPQADVANVIQDEDAADRFATTSKVNIQEPIKSSPSQQDMKPASAVNSKMNVAQQNTLSAKPSSTAHPPAIALLPNVSQSSASLPHPTHSTATMGSSLHVAGGGAPRLTPSSFQPQILETSSTDNFMPYTPRGNLSISIGEPVEVSYEPIKYAPSAIAISGSMDANLKRFKAAAVKKSQQQLQRPQSSQNPTAKVTPPTPVKRPQSTAVKQTQVVKPDNSVKKSAVARKISTAPQNKKPPSSAPAQKVSALPPPRPQTRMQSAASSAKPKSVVAATPGVEARTSKTVPTRSNNVKPPQKSNNRDMSGKRSAPLTTTKSAAAGRKPGAMVKTGKKQSQIKPETTKSKSSLGQRTKTPRLSKHVHGEHPSPKYRQFSIDESAMAAGESTTVQTKNKRLSVTIKPQQHYDLVIPPEKPATPQNDKEHPHKHQHTRKRIRLTDEQKLSSQQQQRTSGGQPLVVPPLTRCQSGEEEGGRRSVNKLYHFPSFSGRSSADCEYIEVVGAARPPIETPLTQAIFDNQEHARLIDKVDKLTGGPHNYRNERGLEDMYGLRVKKFWDRYQLHGTAYLDHLRKDPKYREMPPSVRRTVKQLHANNEHLCQHLYYIKSAACPPYSDNRMPHKFGESINVEAAYRAKNWRKRVELNYKMFQNFLRTRPFCIDAEQCLRESLMRLSWQMFIAKKSQTIKHYKKRLEYNTKCLQDPNYDRNGPPWWRPLSTLEQNILSELLEAQKTDDDDGVCKAMQRFKIHFEKYHLQEALDMCNYGHGATSVGEVGDPLELLYYLRMTPPIREGPYKLRTFFFVGIVLNTPQAQITDVRETMKHFLNWRQAIAEMHKIRRDLAGEPKWPKKVFERLRNIRDAMKIYPGSPYSHINIRWLMHNNKIARQYVRPGPFHIKDNLREFQQWAAAKHYIITKLPDFGRLPQFQKYYTKALEKFRPPERVFLDNC